jgi:Flp pilus assembly protein TadD
LKNAVSDAEGLAGQLTRSGFAVTKLLDGAFRQARSALDVFVAGLKPGDVACFFFAGHGFQSKGEDFLAPIDFDMEEGESRLDVRCLNATAVRDAIERANVHLSLLILDACRDNAFHPGSSEPHGLTLLEPGLGGCVALATGPGQTASDNADGGNGLFTGHLLNEMQQPGRDLDSILNKVRYAVFNSSAGGQRPWIFSNVVAPFYFVQQASEPQRARPAQLVEAGRRAYQEGRFEDAATTFEEAIKADPENPMTYNALGSARVRLKQWSVAVRHFSRAIELKPDYAAAYFNRGVAYYNTPRYPLALQDFTWAIESEPYDPLALDLRGKTHLALRNQEEALADFNHALELDSSDAVALAGKGEVLFRQGSYREAIAQLNASIALRPLVEAYDSRAKSHRALHETALANADATEAEKLRARTVR